MMIAKKVAQKLTQGTMDYATWHKQLAGLAQAENVDVETFTPQALQQSWAKGQDPEGFLYEALTEERDFQERGM